MVETQHADLYQALVRLRGGQFVFPIHTKNRNGLGLALYGERAQGRENESTLSQICCRGLRDDDLPCRRVRHQTRRRVDRVADYGLVNSSWRSDITCRNNPGIDSYSHSELGPLALWGIAIQLDH